MAILSGGHTGLCELLPAIVSRPGRSLAIQILTAHYLDPSEWPERTEREARMIASRSHPRDRTRSDISRQREADI